MNLRDPILPWAGKINAETGQPLTDGQIARLDRLKVAAEEFYNAMHGSEGTIPPGDMQEHEFNTRRMRIAAQHIETALMYACKEALAAK